MTAAPPVAGAMLTFAPSLTRARSPGKTASSAQTDDVSTMVNSGRPPVCSPACATRSVSTPSMGAMIE